MTRRAEWFLVAAVTLAVGWFYFWSARAESARWNFGGKQNDYYNLLVEGFLDGQLHMKVEVPAELARLPNPYDPALRPAGLGLHDASYYDGKYYIYFGVAPLLALLWPFRALTGVGLPLPAAVVVFCFGGFLASAFVWRSVRRRYFPEVGRTMTVLSLLALGTVSMVPLLARRANMWELPISAGYCFAMLAVGGVFRCLHASSTRAARWWFAGAATALGLAVASRPTYLLASGLLAAPVVAWWWQWKVGRVIRQHSAESPELRAKRPILRADARKIARPRIVHRSVLLSALGSQLSTASTRLMLAGIVPMALIGAGLAWYNWVRFDDPLEFGVNYMFSGFYEAKARKFSFEYAPFNLGLYLFQPAEWSRYFPFLHATPTSPTPEGYLGHEEMFGLLGTAPMLALALLAPLAWRGRTSEERGPLKLWLVATALLVAGMALPLIPFYAAMARYYADFTPGLTLLACIGAMAAERALRRDVASGARARTARLVAVAGVRAAMAFSIFCAVMLSCILYGDFRRLSPEGWARVGRVLDYPVHVFEKLTGTAHGPLEFEFRLREQPPGTQETLVRTGWLRATDRILVRHEEGGAFRIGYAQERGTEVWSEPLRPRDGEAWHRARIEMGSLFPPEEHPFFVGFSPAQVSRLARRLRVSINGQLMLDQYQRFHPSSPGVLKIGPEAQKGERRKAEGERFSGEIRAVRRDANLTPMLREAAEAELASADGSVAEERIRTFDRVAFEAVFPAQPANAREPLVVTGQTGRGDFLFVEYLDAERVRFGFDHWGKGGPLSEPVKLGRGVAHRLEISLGSFPGAAAGENAASAPRVVVRVDGQEAWSAPARFYAAEPADIFIGRNPLGGTACSAAFSGEIRAVTRL